jgi:hypothetical protein
MTGGTYIHTYIPILYTPWSQNIARVKTGCGKRNKKFTLHRNITIQKYCKHFRYGIEMLH